ncbi:mechanosensitive ion channel [Blumeria hordei DH14]|uniref:Mechanosensitive ion channel n=1 Tax=Blumeria graminis f. sp. hordei (strain DH14) TaxID=546991 RepID=N1JL73_BLUG1|nr:mechanosensitive ion channel [Blumeria hordei DH14]
MSACIHEKEQISPTEDAVGSPKVPTCWSSEEEDILLGNDHKQREITNRKHFDAPAQDEKDPKYRSLSLSSVAIQREHSQRLDDDLEMLRVERVVSRSETNEDVTGRPKMNDYRSRIDGEPVDNFDTDTSPMHEKTKFYRMPADPTTSLAKLFKKIHQSSVLVRWIVYIMPVTLLLSIPLILGLLVLKEATVGDVEFFWFGVWLEVVWLNLWLSRLIAKIIPWPMGLVSSLFTNNSKKWTDLGEALEIPATIFLWALSIEISFPRTMKNHHLHGNQEARSWEKTTNKIILGVLIGAALNFAEKILIQLIAMSFHLRTYADRIEINKFQISSLVKLYIFSKKKIAMKDSDFELSSSSGAKTPMGYVNLAGKNARHVFTKVGDVAGKFAGDFTGQNVKTSSHPQQVVIQLLRSTVGSQVLARRLYRTFAQENSKTVLPNDLRLAFDNDEEATAAFNMFDKDLNGDISIEELEAVCVEISRERKGITASLKDLDSVVSKLDKVLLFIVFVITTLVFLSFISSSASVMLTSAGSTILALSWLLQATAQEFLQSLIFVFVKHPFDVGDRVTIYGNTGKSLTGDDYFVKEISLLYTEFKKMEGHVVQAPNSYLNTIFILNQRRSGGLAEAIPVTVKFGTTLEQIESLRERMLEFVASESREYQKNILTELTTIYEVYSITLNVVFFYKSNWQNELLRLQRRNKFICALMITMNELNIEGPRMRLAGAAEEFPLYLNNAYPKGHDASQNPQPGVLEDRARASNPAEQVKIRNPSILRGRGDMNNCRRTESILSVGKRVDFSLGMASISSGADLGDVYGDREPVQLPPPMSSCSENATNVSRTKSRDSGSTTKKYRNRLFSRRKSRVADDNSFLDDLEVGPADIIMPGIAEGISEGVSEGATPTYNTTSPLHPT